MKYLPTFARVTLLTPLFAAALCAGQSASAQSQAAAAGTDAAAAPLAVTPVPAHADARAAAVQIRVVPDRADWTYKVGEPVRFNVEVLADRTPLEGAVVNYEVGPEKFPRLKQRATVPAGGLVIEGGTMDEPGFLQCIVSTVVGGKTYNSIATAGIEPEKIQPTQVNPEDFDAFWQKAKDDLAAVPMDPRIELIPALSREKVNVYHISLRVAANGARVYGMLAVPKAPGKYPALLRVPGAGVRGYNPDLTFANSGVITLVIGIHGVPVNLDAEVYQQLSSGALAGYPTFNLDRKDAFYYRRVYLGCVRAIDFLTSLPEWDGKEVGVIGGSQGGQLAIVTAGLDPRVTAVCSIYPAFSDVTGYLHGRAGGWPHMFRPAADGSASVHATEEKIATTAYYDAVNFARRIKAPGIYTWGYNDTTCPPTSMYSAYNSVTAPKTLLLALETGHSNISEQWTVLNDWMLSQLKGEN